MKNHVLIAAVVILAIALGVQSYRLYQLSNKINQLTGQGGTESGPKTGLTRPLLPKPRLKEFPFSDKWAPYAELERMQKEMEQIFEDSFSRFHMNTPLGSLNKTPDVDLRETPDSYIVTVNLPGADESTFSVKVEEDILRISVKTERLSEESNNSDHFRRRERFVGEFQRALTLPGPVDSAKMKTGYKNGVLTIYLPKK